MVKSVMEYNDKANNNDSIEEDKTDKTSKTIKIWVQHKLGSCPVGDTSLVIAVGSPHRKEWYEACEKMLEMVKLYVPIWKKEYFADDTYEVETME